MHCVYRVKELQKNGLSKFIFDPDRESAMKILQAHIANAKDFAEPLIEGWVETMDILPMPYSHTSIVEYLIKRQVSMIDASGKALGAPVLLPIADKPLVKGHNFFASGNVGEVKLNCASDSAVHVRCGVLASMRDVRYDVQCIIDGQTGLIRCAACKCPAGAGGKCNHIAALLFALLDYAMTMRNPDSCTNTAQVWHRPKRATKRVTRPLVVGQRKVAKHVFGRTVLRKRPLEEYSRFRPVETLVSPPNRDVLVDVLALEAAQHSMGLRQILDSSTDTATPDNDDDQDTVSFTPDEIVLRRLQVTVDERSHIERATIGQHLNPEWFRQRHGRLTASKAKRYGGKGNPAVLLRGILSAGSTTRKAVGHMEYGIEHESTAVGKYEASSATPVHVRECGLFVDVENGQLAASPDRIADINGERIVVEVKCLSACRTLSPLDAIRLKQGDSGFAYKMVNGGVMLKEKHPHYYEVQMQMAITGLTMCHLVIFTSPDHDVCVCEVVFDSQFWENVKSKLLDFHATFVVPALVNKMCP